MSQYPRPFDSNLIFLPILLTHFGDFIEHFLPQLLGFAQYGVQAKAQHPAFDFFGVCLKLEQELPLGQFVDNLTAMPDALSNGWGFLGIKPYADLGCLPFHDTESGIQIFLGVEVRGQDKLFASALAIFDAIEGKVSNFLPGVAISAKIPDPLVLKDMIGINDAGGSALGAHGFVYDFDSDVVAGGSKEAIEHLLGIFSDLNRVDLRG